MSSLQLKASDIIQLPPRYGGLLLDHGRHWTQEDTAAVRVLVEAKADLEAIHTIFGRYPQHIADKARVMRIKGIPAQWWEVAGRKFIERVCAHKGCDVDITYEHGKAKYCDKHRARASRPRDRFNPYDLAYPYAVSPVDSTQALMIKINSLVPQGLPGDLRADVCQDVLLAVLEGEIAAEQVAYAIPHYMKGAKKRYYMPWGTIDYTAQRFNDGGNQIIESISDDVQLYG